MALRKDLTYPKILNQIRRTKLPSELGTPSFEAIDEEFVNFEHGQSKEKL